MKGLQPLTELIEGADPELLKELVHRLAEKNPLIKRECLTFLKQEVVLPIHSIPRVNAEEIWTLWEELTPDLSDLDEYGGGSEDTEEHVWECLTEIEKLLKEKEITKEERMDLIDKVLPFIESGNAGVDDSLYDVAYAACKDPEDWKCLAEAFEKIGKEWPIDHARRIYRNIGEDTKYLKLRAKKMIYGLDYYDLATFYSEHGEKEKAFDISQEGMIKATGRMDELREFMAKHYLHEDNRTEFLKIQFIQATDRLSIVSYEKFKKECSLTEWQKYEPQILKILEKAGVYEQLKIRILRQEYAPALHLLQKVGCSSHPWGDSTVWAVAIVLEIKFPEQILEFYRRRLGEYNTTADRKTYTEWAKIAFKIRSMLINALNQPDKWKKMLREMKLLNKQRKAFCEEFSKIIPDWDTG